ncbi:MAG: hypothetical protein EA352_00060 [Gemmatimonadales bacterium]|nr:MAG: hypothetical protein EA352_00060 [Gemmatimonadales bacterium]
MEEGQDRVLRRPGPGLGPEDVVLRRQAPQRLEPGVHAIGIRCQEPGLPGRKPRHMPFGGGAVVVENRRAIGGEGGLPHQLGELSGHLATEEVHLEEAVLPVHEALRPEDVLQRLAPEDGDAQGIAMDADGGRQVGHGDRAVGGREGAPEEDEASHQDEDHGGQRRSQEGEEDDSEGSHPGRPRLRRPPERGSWAGARWGRGQSGGGAPRARWGGRAPSP